MAADGDPAGGKTDLITGALLASVEGVLRDHPDGLTEHGLIDRLRARGIAPFAEANLREPLALFRSHFLLFHCLYRLRDRYLADGQWLRIDCLDIGLEPLGGVARVGDDPRALAAHDPLRAYYLDLSRLEATDAAAIEALLSSFWRRLGRGERRRQALAMLELEDPVDDAAIAARFRTLAQQHHPDRGGDTATLQRLNEARWVLLGKV